MTTPLARGIGVLAAAAVAATSFLATPTTAAGSPAAQVATLEKAVTADRVVVIVVDALSRELVERYDMTNVQKLMSDGVDSPNGYLGHLGSVTVVTHNILTSGVLPKRAGWVSEGFRDLDDTLKAGKNKVWVTSDWEAEQMFKVQKKAGYPKLADYLHRMRPGSQVVTVSPKTYAGYAFGGQGADSIVTFSSADYDCDKDGEDSWRGPDGVNVPSYIAEPECGRFYVESSQPYDTLMKPARMYPLDGNRYTIGKDPEHYGGDVWAADAAIQVMQHEKDWSGVFVTLPGVDKSAHMWGGVIDEGAKGPKGDPMTHIEEATRVADEQVGRIVEQLRTSGELDNTLVVLTADHGQVPGKHFHGLDDGAEDRGFYNWYYGALANGDYLDPQPKLEPLVDTGNVEMSYSDSMISAWVRSRRPERLADVIDVMSTRPGVTAVWLRQGKKFVRQTPVRNDRMTKKEKRWFKQHAQELLNTMAAKHGPDVVATLADDTTYSVAGDHGGIQRRAQQIPIVFYGADLGSEDLTGPVRSVDVMATVMEQLGIEPTRKLDGKAWPLPKAG